MEDFDAIDDGPGASSGRGNVADADADDMFAIA